MSHKLSHLDPEGRASMVDVGHKPETERRAVARGSVMLPEEAFVLARNGDLKKGDIRAAAELAGVMAAKNTADIIPLCHPLLLTYVDVSLSFDDLSSSVEIEAEVRTTGKTGVEMEALTAVSAAALTVYDMIKAVTKTARITNIRLVEKEGGQSGHLILE
ncbi:MAG: cyclic pyranopterin monophosphate synthase MoaC [Anaerolineales bacterium]|nr:cyclic pyranopterin monophosphate synthase MoaC [Anaerolineales bacterium]